MTKPSLVIVLAEGARDQRFVWRYLRKTGLQERQIRLEPVPGGSGGAGDEWVIDRYPAAVNECRRRAAKTALIVVIDADTEDVSRRVRQLSEALGKNARKDAEAIVHLIPKRNIETWILHLNGEEVDEEKDHRNRDVDDLIPAAAAAFYIWTPQPPERCLASLRAAIEETKRLT